MAEKIIWKGCPVGISFNDDYRWEIILWFWTEIEPVFLEQLDD
jgi:hypothetical protein